MGRNKRVDIQRTMDGQLFLRQMPLHKHQLSSVTTADRAAEADIEYFLEVTFIDKADRNKLNCVLTKAANKGPPLFAADHED